MYIYVEAHEGHYMHNITYVSKPKQMYAKHAYVNTIHTRKLIYLALQTNSVTYVHNKVEIDIRP